MRKPDWEILNVHVLDNYRTGEPFEHIFPKARCKLCNSQTTAYIRIDEKSICSSCLHDMIEMLKDIE